MLTLVFAEPGAAPVVKRGPFDEVRADAKVMRAGQGGPVIARHEDHSWYLGAEKFFRIDCDGPVQVHFENSGSERSELFGPFFHFSSADGVAFADGEICAHVDVDACLWYCHRNERYWTEMVVTPAG
jgi:hypothetical protein